MSTEEGKQEEKSAEQGVQQAQQVTEEKGAERQVVTQQGQEAVAKPAEAKPVEVKLPRPRVSLSGKLRRLLRIRILMERREPRWMRMDEWRFLRVAHGEHWRRPRGNDNKIRLEIKGYPKRV
ncbi:MAG: eL32 family ribosomal protein, partial [Vulcanisaeta sp.]